MCTCYVIIIIEGLLRASAYLQVQQQKTDACFDISLTADDRTLLRRFMYFKEV